MRLTVSQLRKIIKEEAAAVLRKSRHSRRLQELRQVPPSGGEGGWSDDDGMSSPQMTIADASALADAYGMRVDEFVSLIDKFCKGTSLKVVYYDEDDEIKVHPTSDDEDAAFEELEGLARDLDRELGPNEEQELESFIYLI